MGKQQEEAMETYRRVSGDERLCVVRLRPRPTETPGCAAGARAHRALLFSFLGGFEFGLALLYFF
jgi:hypothetical protein